MITAGWFKEKGFKTQHYEDIGGVLCMSPEVTGEREHVDVPDDHKLNCVSCQRLLARRNRSPNVFDRMAELLKEG